MRDYDGKTAAERVAQRREQLIAAGLEVFGTQGYSSASIRAVLERAGLRARYFAENFADLDDLMAAVFDRIVEGEVAVATAAAAAAKAGPGRARAVFGALIEYLEDDPRRARIKLREVLAAGPVSRLHRQSAMAGIGALFAGMLPPSTPDRDYDPQVFGLALASVGYELLIARLSDDPDVTREQVVDVQTTLYKGIVHALTVP
ncbi:TetR/AcrR family transcriptional regulator [Actinoplanes sp. TBRC 11911]|uniref:TetR/AcrR family transcriptional regulator n=1 Tax=Actinoplanes sp. TBRC 11911 TaxID=2729386 RepID=UPI00145EBB4E|nr:TetR/AcrR family transcriptional regulator [Actinoplanes sp. TBRC 11911]NMO56207.1 TetR/AcrR family transcriptional regulator [Actinoplanes sp. TBRC 11911]